MAEWDRKGVFGGEEEGDGVRSGPGEARTRGIYGARLLFLVSAKTNKRHHHHRYTHTGDKQPVTCNIYIKSIHIVAPTDADFCAKTLNGVHMCVCICICKYICIYVYIYICIYIYTHKYIYIYI